MGYVLFSVQGQGWVTVSGPVSWGKLKLIHSAPTKSNGGQVTLALIFAEYIKSHPGATPQTPSFLSFLRGIENSVVSFPDTTSKWVDAMIKGSRDQCDAAIVYEANAIKTVDKGNMDLRVIYPNPTVGINFQAAIVKAPWVTDDQAKMAASFRDYLLTRDVQMSALNFGFRPALTDTRSAVDDSLSEGVRRRSGFELDTILIDRPVGTQAIDSLLFQWYKLTNYGHDPWIETSPT